MMKSVRLVSILDQCHRKGSMAFLMIVRQGSLGLGALALLDWFGGAYYGQNKNLCHCIFEGTLFLTAKKKKCYYNIMCIMQQNELNKQIRVFNLYD